MAAPVPDRFEGPGASSFWAGCDNAFTEYVGAVTSEAAIRFRRLKAAEMFRAMAEMIDGGGLEFKRTKHVGWDATMRESE